MTHSKKLIFGTLSLSNSYPSNVSMKYLNNNNPSQHHNIIFKATSKNCFVSDLRIFLETYRGVSLQCIAGYAIEKETERFRQKNATLRLSE